MQRAVARRAIAEPDVAAGRLRGEEREIVAGGGRGELSEDLVA
jgi:hypothetical protein